jgi:hypothetical protein
MGELVRCPAGYLYDSRLHGECPCSSCWADRSSARLVTRPDAIRPSELHASEQKAPISPGGTQTAAAARPSMKRVVRVAIGLGLAIVVVLATGFAVRQYGYEYQLYHASRGNIGRLKTYLVTCWICRDSRAALNEITFLAQQRSRLPPTQPEVHAPETSEQVCRGALDQSASTWATDPGRAGSVEEAIKRGFNIGNCRQVLGISEPSPPPPPLPPPAPERPPPSPAPTVYSQLNTLALDFIEHLYNTASAPAGDLIAASNSNYADQVDYYGETIPRDKVLAQLRSFLDRWPHRQYSVRPDTLKITCSEFPMSCGAEGLLDFDDNDPTRNARSWGTATFEYALRFSTLDEPPRIVQENGQVIARHFQPFSSSSYPSLYQVDGFALGAQVAFDSDAYKRYSCGPSEKFSGFTWCHEEHTRGVRRNEITRSHSILHSQNGIAWYINSYTEPAVFEKDEVQKDIARLSAKFGEPADQIPMTERKDLPHAVLAIWGTTTLEQLTSGELTTIVSGGTVPGLLVSYLGDIEASAKAQVPVFRLVGGAGFVWAASFNEAGRGVLRYLAVDASKIGDLAATRQ